MLSSPTITRSLTRLSVLALAVAPVVGCADAITYSRSERRTAEVYLEEGDASSAAVLYGTITHRDPLDYKAHYGLARARQDLGRYEQAITSYKTALRTIDLTPKGKADFETRMAIVNGLSETLAQHDRSGSQTAAIAAGSKGDPYQKLLLAKTYAASGQPDAALGAYQEAYNLDRNDPQIAKDYGLYLKSINQTIAAEEVLRRAYALNSRDEEVAASLRELGVVPGPGLLSANELAKPPVPVGPLPELDLGPIQTGRPAESTSAAPVSGEAAVPTDPALN